MKCPFCGCVDTKVLDSRPNEDRTAIRRRRECDRCQRRFTTYEKIETIPLIVIKKDNNREAYDRTKIEKGVRRLNQKQLLNICRILGCKLSDIFIKESISATFSGYKSATSNSSDVSFLRLYSSILPLL